MKIKLGIFFGGKSVEHEVAVITAHQAYENINKGKYEIVPIYISKEGVMYTGANMFDLSEYKDMEKLKKRCTKVCLINDGESIKILRYPTKKFGDNIINTIDIAFPIMHGTNGEDGTIQGYLQALGLPFVGCDILASSVGMDKIAAKKILKESGLPVIDYVSFYSEEYIKDEEKYINKIEEKLNYPLIIKPANLGSSVGIKKAKDRIGLEEAIEFAMQFAEKILVENAVTNMREINCSIIGNGVDCETSLCEEPISTDEILSYQDKYVGGGKTKGGSHRKRNGRKQEKITSRFI